MYKYIYIHIYIYIDMYIYSRTHRCVRLFVCMHVYVCERGSELTDTSKDQSQKVSYNDMAQKT